MKIKTIHMDYDDVMKLPTKLHKKPRVQSPFWRKMMKILGEKEMKKAGVTVEEIGMDELPENTPCLYLMNHSCFLDLSIAASLIYPKPFHIVCTSDGMVGKEKLMRALGCIPTNKFVPDITLIKDMVYVSKKLHSSVLMYPEASYSFDGTATPIPRGFGKFVKTLGLPVVMIETKGAFLRDPLYNGLQVRDVNVSVKEEYILSKHDVEKMTTGEIFERVNSYFKFDQFKMQLEDGVEVKESFRADHLNRVLYKCPSCKTEGMMEGKGIYLTCKECGKKYLMTELGQMQALSKETEFSHIPDWYKWEREEVRKELEDGTYSLDIPVSIGILKDTNAIYMVGDGVLKHNRDGFVLDGCDGRLHYEQSPKFSYSLYSDYYWYEIGDMICIGNNEILYYCFPKVDGDFVAKTRLASEELFHLLKKKSE